MLDARKGLGFNTYLDLEYKKSWKEYEQMLVEDEIHWYQKSRVKWLYMWDKNTSIFMVSQL